MRLIHICRFNELSETIEVQLSMNECENAGQKKELPSIDEAFRKIPEYVSAGDLPNDVNS